MARNPVTAAKEGDVTSVAQETPQFDDENLRGEELHAQQINFAKLTPLPIFFPDVRVIFL